MIVTPYSSLITSSQLAPTAVNFPFLKHFWPCTELVGTNTITDSVGGVVLTANSLSNPDAFSVATTTGAKATSGTLFTPGTSPFLFFAVAKFGANNIRMGSNTGTYIDLGSASPVLYESASFANPVATAFANTTVGTIYGRAHIISAYNSATGQQTMEFDAANLYSSLAATATTALNGGTALSSMGAISTGANGWLPPTTNAIYGMALLKFASIPTNLKVGLAWMTYQWSIGNKAIYPAWRDIS